MSPYWRGLIFLAGGLSLFLFGMRLASAELRNAAGGRLRVLLALLTHNRFVGVAVGAVTALMLNSSAAATVALVGMANAGFLEARQFVAILLGYTIGTTLVIQIITYDLSVFALIPVAAGFLLHLLPWRAVRITGGLLLGMGLVFFGMTVMRSGVEPLLDEAFREVLGSLFKNPFVGLASGFLFTAFIESSAATVAMIKPIVGNGLTLEAAVPLILGANVGTCIAGLLASSLGGPRGRQVAFSHLAIRLLAAVIFFPLAVPLADLSRHLTDYFLPGDLPRALANAHTIFTLATVAILLPFTGLLARAIERLFPEVGPLDRFLRELDLHLLEKPQAALERAWKELRKMAVLTQQMFVLSLKALESDSDRQARALLTEDDRIDLQNQAILDYLARLKAKPLSPDEARQRMHILFIAEDIEEIGDVLSKEVFNLAIQRIRSGLNFPVEAWVLLKKFHGKILGSFEALIKVLEQRNPQAAKEILETETLMDQERDFLRANHLRQMARGVLEAKKTSAIYLNLLNQFRLVHFHIANTARYIKGEERL